MLETIFEFSRQNCVAICAFLVPANLIATLTAFFLVFYERPQSQIRLVITIGCSLALVMILHVATWLMIGVVMTPTFILTMLGLTCLGINLSLIGAGSHYRKIGQLGINLIRNQILPKFNHLSSQ